MIKQFLWSAWWFYDKAGQFCIELLDTGTICKKKKTFASRNFHNLAFDREIANFLPLKISCYADGINPKYYSKLCYTSL